MYKLPSGVRKTKTPEYWVWNGIKRRCTDKRRNNYARYGGKGITIASEWLEFECFYSYIGPRPTKKHQIDRIDNNKGYEPGNVHWVTITENQRNKPSVIKIEHKGRLWTISEIAEKAGVTRSAVWFRYLKKVSVTSLFAKYRKFKHT